MSGGPVVARRPGGEAFTDTGSLRPVRAALWFGFFNAMTWQVALGTPMVMLGEQLGASTFAIGTAYSFLYLLTPVQVLATSLLPRFGCRRMMLSGWGTRSLFLLPVIWLAWLAPEQGSTWHVAVFLLSLFLFTLARSFGSCAWLPWINALLTAENRGRYFASEQAISGIAGVGTLLICSLSLAVMPLYDAFLIQYAFAFAGSWFAYAALARLPDAPRPGALPLRTVVEQTPRLLLEPGPFRQFVTIGVLLGAAVTAIPPFCAYYLKVGPGDSPARIVFYTLIQYVGVISGAILIRKQVDRVGARPFFLLSLTVYVVIALFWIVLLRGWARGLDYVPVVYFLVGFAASCWAAANMKYLPLAIAPERRTLAFSVHAAVTAVASGVAASAWGLVIKSGGPEPGVDVGWFQIYFLAALVTLVPVAFLVGRLPAAAGVSIDWQLATLTLRPFRGFTNLATLVLPRAGGTGPATRAAREPDGNVSPGEAESPRTP